MQETYFHNPPSLLIQNNGDWEQLKVDIHNMTPDQAAQVFSEDHVRTDGEQRAWIEDDSLPIQSQRTRSDIG